MGTKGTTVANKAGTNRGWRYIAICDALEVLVAAAEVLTYVVPRAQRYAKNVRFEIAPGVTWPGAGSFDCIAIEQTNTVQTNTAARPWMYEVCNLAANYLCDAWQGEHTIDDVTKPIMEAARWCTAKREAYEASFRRTMARQKRYVGAIVNEAVGLALEGRLPKLPKLDVPDDVYEIYEFIAAARGVTCAYINELCETANLMEVYAPGIAGETPEKLNIAPGIVWPCRHGSPFAMTIYRGRRKKPEDLSIYYVQSTSDPVVTEIYDACNGEPRKLYHAILQLREASEWGRELAATTSGDHRIGNRRNSTCRLWG